MRVTVRGGAKPSPTLVGCLLSSVIAISAHAQQPTAPASGKTPRADTTAPALTSEAACALMKEVDSLNNVLAASGAVKADTSRQGVITTKEVKSDSTTQARLALIAKHWEDAFAGRRRLYCRDSRSGGSRSYMR